MKNIIKLFILSLLVSSCGDFEPVVYDQINGQTGIGFTTVESSVTVPVAGISTTITVQTTNKLSSARTFGVAVDESSTGSSADYTIGTLSIPAESYEGTLDVTFGNFDNLPDLVTNKLVLNLDLPEGASVVGSSSTTINYVKAVVCNDLTLTINEDNYADERDWTITDSSGAIVAQCSDYAICPGGAPSGSLAPAQYVYDMTLSNGCYTFTIFDSYGDGLFDGSTTGDYALTCSVISHAAGSGNFGASESTDFCVNQ